MTARPSALDRTLALLRRPPVPAGLPLGERIEFHRHAAALMERELWRDGIDDEKLALYQALCREMEEAIAAGGADERHRFVITIPVADRPQHLDACLTSLLELCRLYGYGGMEGGRWRKVSVVIADDSRDEASIAAHRAIAERFSGAGLATHHLSQQEQRSLMKELGAATQSELAGVIGEGEDYRHKGASITRNLAYLKLNQLAAEGERTLFYFIDSDQEFRVNVETPRGERLLYAINYLHHLDRIFSDTGAAILTGKVVGDPPVAPAVMAGNFLDDVNRFLAEMTPLEPDADCTFHADTGRAVNDAAYHDMADLFGYRPTVDAYRYRCDLGGTHDHAACLARFAEKLEHFFDGEHPTRKSVYQPDDLAATLQPARTVYTGNYLFTAEGLEWFIPFAPLKLRMAGPVLGRIIQAEIGGRFLSANLPMLHKRTVEEIGRSEFRPGIEREGIRIDLGGEFERQYFGDVMLFTVARLTEGGRPLREIDEGEIATTLEAVEAEMFEKYSVRRGAIAEKIQRLHALFGDHARWWQRDATLAEAREAFRRFSDNIDHNFGADSRAYQRIHSDAHRRERKAAIRQAILRYGAERDAWRAALDSQRSEPA